MSSEFAYAKSCINKIAQSSPSGDINSVIMVWPLLNIKSKNLLTDRAFELLQAQNDSEEIHTAVSELLRKHGFVPVGLAECAQEGVPLKRRSKKAIVTIRG